MIWSPGIFQVPRGYTDPSTASNPGAAMQGGSTAYGGYGGYDPGYGYGYGYGYAPAGTSGQDYSRDDYGGYASGYQQFPGHWTEEKSKEKDYMK